MKITKEIPVPATTRKDERFVCDGCQQGCGPNERGRTSYDIQRVEIEMEEGAAYPGSVMRHVTRIDACTTCFKKRILPALEALGFPAHTEDRY